MLLLRFLDYKALTLASVVLRGAGDHLRGKSLSLAINDARQGRLGSGWRRDDSDVATLFAAGALMMLIFAGCQQIHAELLVVRNLGLRRILLRLRLLLLLLLHAGGFSGA